MNATTQSTATSRTSRTSTTSASTTSSSAPRKPSTAGVSTATSSIIAAVEVVGAAAGEVPIDARLPPQVLQAEHREEELHEEGDDLPEGLQGRLPAERLLLEHLAGAADVDHCAVVVVVVVRVNRVTKRG